MGNLLYGYENKTNITDSYIPEQIFC